MAERFIIFCKATCPFCVSALQVMQEHNLSYSEVSFEPEQEQILSEIKGAYSWKTVPMIFSRTGDDIKFIGGYTDLLDHLELDEQ